jgi:hypothetical protein
MKNILPFFACFAVVCIISCKNKQDQPGTTNTSNQEYVLPSTLNNQQQGNSSSGTSSEKIDMQPVKTDQLTTNTSNANVKLNPAHGEPGHRCDIAVGAPLDGSVQQTTTSVQPVTVNTQPTSKTTTNSNAKLNPAHGQPGHRCDIAVGAPLDGSVQQTTNVQPVTVNTQPATNTTTNSSQPIPKIRYSISQLLIKLIQTQQNRSR